MKNHLTLAPMTAQQKLTAWLELTRFDKPVGTELLLYPTLWSLFLASAELGRLPDWDLLLIFTLGAVCMRAAGCAINDFADRKVDGRVKRTCRRPLADGRLSAKTAVATFLGLSLISACLLFFLPVVVFYWALAAVVLAFVYPFMKRYTHLPQVVLAAAFGWAVPMAFVATLGEVGAVGWATFLAYMCWTVAYDTQYAMCDRDDDIQIGVKSTAILFEKIFGRYEIWAVVALQSVFVLVMSYLYAVLIGGVWVVLLLGLTAMFFVQYRLLTTKERLNYFTAFAQNAIVGRVVFAVIAVGCVVRFWGG